MQIFFVEYHLHAGSGIKTGGKLTAPVLWNGTVANKVMTFYSN